ncbi:cyclin-T1-3-like [Bidens hawaiensis]|uniref:cyclin-T1-3-like n=1 Tax=Bidens hawaiensis TaxID=980011 RepID=UPI00404A0529
MAVKMQCDVSQREIAGDEVEASQVVGHKWYFSRKEIESCSPSRYDGIDYKQEEHLRKIYCSFLQELGMELKVPQLTIATAIMFCHRFYMRQSHAKNDWQTMATVCMFLACKAEETPRWLNELVVVAYKLIHKGDPSASRRIREIYDKQKELILIGERLLLHVLAFDMNIEHPYKPLIAALKRLDITHKDLVKVAWNFVNDWLRTSLCLQHKPHYIAAGSLVLATKIMKVKLPTSKGKAWWMEFDVSPKQLEDVVQQMMSLWQHSPSQVQSQSHCHSQSQTLKDAKVTEPPIRKATTTTPNSVKKEVFEKVKDTSRETTNGQMSETGSGVSVVEDGDIGEPVTLNKSDLSSSCKTTNLVKGIVGNCVGVDPVTLNKSDLSSSCKTTNSVKGIVGNCTGVDVNKIREKIKNRSLIKTMKRAREEVKDDGEDWIERELENGIVLQSAYPRKQMKV